MTVHMIWKNKTKQKNKQKHKQKKHTQHSEADKILFWVSAYESFKSKLTRNSPVNPLSVRGRLRECKNPEFVCELKRLAGWPYGWFWNFFWTVLLKAHDWSSWILTKCNLSWKIVKCRILSEVCMINSIVSPQMWCIKSIKGWFTHPQICWQEFVK